MSRSATDPNSNADKSSGLQADEIEVFARGLHYLASVDGIEPQEEQVIRDFLKESGSSIAFEDIQSEGFTPAEAAARLDNSFLRRVFIKAAIVLIRADGQVTTVERQAIGEFADAFGIGVAEYLALEHRASDETL